MTNIPSIDLTRFSKLAREVYQARDYRDITGKVLGTLNREFRLSVAVCESLSFDCTQYSRDGEISALPAPPVDHYAAMHDCPHILQLANGNRSPQLRLLQYPKVDRTDFFNVLVRPFGVRDQMLNLVWGENRITIFNIARDLPLSEPERAMFQLLHRHLGAALRRVEAHRPPTAAPFGSPWVPLDPAARPAALTPSQAQVLKTYFPAWRPTARGWPAQVSEWLHTCQRAFSIFSPDRPLRALVVHSSRGRLIFRYFPGSGATAPAVRMTELATAPNYSGLALRAGLSHRETEVVHWLAQGKRDAEIGQILNVSAATISRHTHHILRKLQIHSRAGIIGALLKQV